MALTNLTQVEPLGENLDRITDFVDVSSYRKLRLNCFSDTLLDVHVEWSHDGVRKCIASSVKVASQLWRSEELSVLMPFMRFHIINNSGKPNMELHISAHSFGVPRAQESSEAPKCEAPVISKACEIKLEHEDVILEDAPKKRVWFGKKSESKSPKHVCRDDRLPGFLPMNSLLISDRKGALIPLAPGNVGDILLMACDGPVWFPRKDLFENHKE